MVTSLFVFDIQRSALLQLNTNTVLLGLIEVEQLVKQSTVNMKSVSL